MDNLRVTLNWTTLDQISSREVWGVIRVQDTRDFIVHCHEMNSPGQDCMELTYLYTKWWNCEEIWRKVIHDKESLKLPEGYLVPSWWGSHELYITPSMARHRIRRMPGFKTFKVKNQTYLMKTAQFTVECGLLKIKR